MTEQSIFLEYVGDNPRMRVLQYLIEGRELDYTLTDLLNAGVSWGTLNQLVPKLLELEIVVKTRKIGRATLYKINQENRIAKHFIILYDDLILEQLDKLEEKQTVKITS
jgi:DNA-binding transcriptional ArsR family regulator